MSTFLLEFWVEKDDFCIYAYGYADEYEKEVTLEGKAEQIIADFDAIYDILEEKKESKLHTLQETINKLTALLITPFAKQIKACSLVRFQISEELVNCSFDLLTYENAPLFVQRKVCYQIAEGEGEDAPKLELSSALLIADLSADPEEACKAVSKLIEDSEYAKMEDANLKMIKDSAAEVDILVVSAHGDLDDDNSGGVSINKETITGKLIGQLECWVVYFDSCGQGANLDFLKAFQEESDCQFYLAPIISNDAGDSSTKTMLWFFTDLLKHGDPIKALFDTRKRLYDFYLTGKKLTLITTLNKSFAFRLYEFVDGE